MTLTRLSGNNRNQNRYFLRNLMKNNHLQLSALLKKGTLILGLGLLSGGMSSQAATDCNAVTEILPIE